MPWSRCRSCRGPWALSRVGAGWSIDRLRRRTSPRERSTHGGLYIALAWEVPDNWQELMRPYTEQLEATMARYGGFYRTWLRHRVEVVEGEWGSHQDPTIVEFPRSRSCGPGTTRRSTPDSKRCVSNICALT